LRGGDFGALLAVPGPDVVLVADRTAVQAGAPKQGRGAAAVAGAFSGHARAARPALLNGATIAPTAPEMFHLGHLQRFRPSHLARLRLGGSGATCRGQPSQKVARRVSNSRRAAAPDRRLCAERRWRDRRSWAAQNGRFWRRVLAYVPGSANFGR
jgi:hypothetical protein